MFSKPLWSFRASRPHPLVSRASWPIVPMQVTMEDNVSRPDLDCSVCLQLLCEPVVAPCGHDLCKVRAMPNAARCRTANEAKLGGFGARGVLSH